MPISDSEPLLLRVHLVFAASVEGPNENYAIAIATAIMAAISHTAASAARHEVADPF
jgi:hypothetical protein